MTVRRANQASLAGMSNAEEASTCLRKQKNKRREEKRGKEIGGMSPRCCNRNGFGCSKKRALRGEAFPGYRPVGIE